MNVELVQPISETAAAEARQLLTSYQVLLVKDLNRLTLNRSEDRQLFRDEIARCDRAIAALASR
jgi:hypothetical protein